jgi:two-component system, OmpR family, sensor kinase
MRMSLATRLTAFFLGALALVLAGFSAALFLLARSSLDRQVEDRLEAALNTLAATSEFNRQGLEWEPNERLVALGRGPEAGQVAWLVRSGTGAEVARSRNSVVGDILDRVSPRVETPPRRPIPALIRSDSWEVVQRRIIAPGLDDPETRREANHHRVLILTAGLDRRPLEATLAPLIRNLIGLSLTLWLLAALVARRLCRRALRPVKRMSEAARAMGAGEWERRLPVPRTDDELQDLGDAFNGLLARLHEAFERQRRFTGDASHQLRTPLAAMLGQIEVSLRRERSAEEYRRVLSMAHDQAAHLGQMVEMLLFLARADVEAELPGLEEIDLTGWIEGQRPRWADHPRSADLHLDLGDVPRLVRVHPPLLAQLIDNLIDNALKYSADGTPITIRLGYESDAGQVALTVEDRGLGIDAQDLPHLFEPFYRSASARRAGRAGVGLGLSVAHRIAATFRGSLVVRSVPGQGSHFILLLPEVGDEILAEIPAEPLALP